MPGILFDTDIIIDFLRGNKGALTVMSSVKEEDIPCCSVVTLAELRAGMKDTEEEATGALLEGFDILPITRQIAQLAGDIKRTTRQQKLELDDCFIAATAMLHDAVLVTHNTRHYPHKNLRLQKAAY